MGDFSAIYLPALPPTTPDPSRRGFETEDEAQEYVFSQMCKWCKEQRQMFLDGVAEDEDNWPEEYPGCYFEWVIVPTEKADGNLDELMAAAGWETIYSRKANA